MAYKQFIIFQTLVWLQIFDKIHDSIPSKLYMINANIFIFNKKLSDLKI